MSNDPSDASSVAPSAAGAMPRGALGAWWREGLRSAFLRRPAWSGLHVSPQIVVVLVLVPLLLGALAQRLYILGPASFYWPALLSGWVSTLVSVWICWLIGRHAPDGAPGPAALFSMLSAQWLTFTALLGVTFVALAQLGSPQRGAVVSWVLWLLPLLWMGGAQALLLWRSGSGSARVRGAAGVVLLLVLALTQWVHPLQLWYPQPSDETSVRDEPLRLTQALIEAQQALLPQRLQALPASRAGVIDLYTLTFAPYADEDVFRRESDMVAQVIGERFDARERTLQLVNHAQTVQQWPWATRLNLQRAIRRIGELMNRDEDILFIHLTSHGARNGTLSASFWPLEVEPVTPELLKAWLDEAGVRWRVVSVSACFSGSWIAPLTDADTLVMTAADADHTSYGCGRGSELTYYGRAMYDEQMRHTLSFEQAHAKARGVIEQREREAGKSDGFSNPQIHVGAAIAERLTRLEAQQQAASHRPPN